MKGIHYWIYIIAFFVLAYMNEGWTHDAPPPRMAQGIQPEAGGGMPSSAQPQGWRYPFSCCSGYDCRRVNDDDSPITIKQTKDGYVISSTGEVVSYSDARRKDSPDGEYHWCSVAGAIDGRTICLFVPPPSI